MLHSKHLVPSRKYLLHMPKIVFTLGGIFKPISRRTFLPNKWKFQGISVFNRLLPLDHDRQTCLSDSSGFRRLNRGSCHTPKFALPISSSIIQESRVSAKKQPPNRGPPKLGFACYQKNLNF